MDASQAQFHRKNPVFTGLTAAESILLNSWLAREEGAA
jgi:hypothetical protein